MVIMDNNLSAGTFNTEPRFNRGSWVDQIALPVRCTCMYRLENSTPPEINYPSYNHTCSHSIKTSDHISYIYLSYKTYSQTWLPQNTLRIIYMSTPISRICTEQDKKHLLAFLLLAINIHAASYTRQTFLTFIPIKKKERTPRASSKTHLHHSSCLPLHLLASLRSRQIFSTPWRWERMLGSRAGW
jgi:hypothetical protein